MNEDLLESFWYYKTSTLYTSLPCVIIKVHDNLSQQRVDVKPLTNRLFRDFTVEEHPVILSVPVMFPASETSAFTFPINVGDTVLCSFSQRSLDGFKSGQGNLYTPLDFRRFSIRDAIAVPGLFPFSEAVNNPTKRTLPHSTEDTVIVHNIGTDNEAEVRIKPTGEIKVTSPIRVVVDAPTARFTGDLDVDGSVTVGDTLTAATDVIGGDVSLVEHVHGGVTSGGSNTSPPVV